MTPTNATKSLCEVCHKELEAGNICQKCADGINRRPMLLIGLGHKARQGKDTLATFLVNKLKYQLKIIRVAHADFLKKEVNDVILEVAVRYNISDQDATRQICARYNLPFDETPDYSDPLCPYGKQRQLLQWWGTEYRRAQDSDYWVKRLNQFLLVENPSIAVITDMRFPNEFQNVKRCGGVTINVRRKGYDHTQTPNFNHRSETALDKAHYDYIIEAANLNDLYNQGNEVLALLRRKDF